MNINNIFFSTNIHNNNIFNFDITKKHIFFYIAQKIIDMEPITKIINMNIGIIRMFIIMNKYSIKNKFGLITNIEKSIFYNNIILDNFLNLICKIQKIYFALIKFKNIYIHKKAKIQIDYDICLNQIDTTKKTCMCIYQNNKLYWFLIRDLINIINTDLTNSPGFFSEPLLSKNPYNNIPFNKSTLYNIYFTVKSCGIKMPELIHKFFLTNFDLRKFTNDYEYLIREYAIDNYVKNTSDAALYKAVVIMLKSYNKSKKLKFNIIIHDEFPKETLVKILKPCVLLYFKYNYSLIELVRKHSVFELKKKLKLLKLFNHCFGRKMYKVNRINNVNTTTVYFNDTHINFNNVSPNNFLLSHTDTNFDNIEEDIIEEDDIEEEDIDDEDIDDEDDDDSVS